MRRGWKLAVLVLLLGGIGFALFYRRENAAQIAAAECRREMKQRGFKIDLEDFDFSTSPELRERAKALTEAGAAARYLWSREMRQLSHPVGTNAALVLWKQSQFESGGGQNDWPKLRARLKETQGALDAACVALIAGPVRFEPKAGPGGDLIVPYLADIRSLAFALATRVVIELHESESGWAWTNLLALTRLVTQWRPQPVEVEYMVRAGAVTIAYNATWEALQWDGWTDAQLTQLQTEWEGAEFLSGLPETAGLSCASMVAVCRFERGQPNSPRTPLRQIGTDLMRSPPMAWSELVQPMRESRYRKYGTYEDEKELMLVFSERERELSAALKKSSWAEMRAMPGITNASAFEGAQGYSRMRGRVRGAFPMYQNGPGLVARLAEAESRRRVVMTALALQRFRRQQGGFPDALAELSPQWVKHVPADFSDARGLRYRKEAAGGFALYSIGLDCIDQGGRMAPLDQGAAVTGPFARPLAPDLVWPRVATQEEIEEQRRDVELARKGADQVSPDNGFRRRYGLVTPGETNAVGPLSIPPARVRAR